MKGKFRIDDILSRVDRLPVLDPRTTEEILGYDECGLPQSTDIRRVTETTASETASAVKYPDFAARRKKIFGNRVGPGADLLIKDRGRY